LRHDNRPPQYSQTITERALRQIRDHPFRSS
jgi:hypothetical protein